MGTCIICWHEARPKNIKKGNPDCDEFFFICSFIHVISFWNLHRSVSEPFFPFLLPCQLEKSAEHTVIHKYKKVLLWPHSNQRSIKNNVEKKTLKIDNDIPFGIIKNLNHLNSIPGVIINKIILFYYCTSVLRMLNCNVCHFTWPTDCRFSALQTGKEGTCMHTRTSANTQADSHVMVHGFSQNKVGQNVVSLNLNSEVWTTQTPESRCSLWWWHHCTLIWSKWVRKWVFIWTLTWCFGCSVCRPLTLDLSCSRAPCSNVT